MDEKDGNEEDGNNFGEYVNKHFSSSMKIEEIESKIDTLLKEEEENLKALQKDYRNLTPTNAHNLETKIREDRKRILKTIEKCENDYSSEVENAKKHLREMTEARKTQKLTGVLKEIEVLLTITEVNNMNVEKLYNLKNLLDQITVIPKTHEIILKKISLHLSDLKTKSLTSFDKILHELNWGKEKPRTDIEDLDSFNTIVQKIVHLQIILQKCTGRRNKVLDIVSRISDPFRRKFRYHFYGDKPTNQMSRPSYMFSYITTILENYLPFIQRYIQPITVDLYNSFREFITGSEIDDLLQFEKKFLDPVTSFINVLNEELVKKMSRNLTLFVALSLERERVKGPQIFMKYINEIISYERAQRDENILVDSVVTKIMEMPTNTDILEFWVRHEKSGVMKKIEHMDLTPYHQSVQSQQRIHREEHQNPSVSTYNMIRILSVLNERYKLITNLEIRKRLLVEINREILNDALVFYSGNINRHIPDIVSQEIEWTNYCMMVNSCLYIENNIRVWGELNFVIELEEIADDDENEDIFLDLADRFIICADKMSQTFIRTIMEYVKLFFANEYLKEGNVDDIGWKTKFKLLHIQKYIQKNRFSKIWRLLAMNLESFFIKHFELSKLKKKKKTSSGNEKLFGDIRKFVAAVFEEFTEKPLNFVPKLKKYIRKEDKK